MAKVTFSVDDDTVRTLKATAERLGKSQSLVVREAVAEYAARAGRLTERERRRMLKALDDMTSTPATRPQADVERELREIHRARHLPGRLHPNE
ncbi:MAG TPA: ribbon-helix-helix protein, CopG family [Vicinamibacterales bacterium]|nr:ribbon-helix-helix protein, CopG family [Vicinamibacterales bacterium]